MFMFVRNNYHVTFKKAFEYCFQLDAYGAGITFKRSNAAFSNASL